MTKEKTGPRQFGAAADLFRFIMGSAAFTGS